MLISLLVVVGYRFALQRELRGVFVTINPSVEYSKARWSVTEKPLNPRLITDSLFFNQLAQSVP